MYAECAASFYRAPQLGRPRHKLCPSEYLASAPRGPHVSRDGDRQSLPAEADLRKDKFFRGGGGLAAGSNAGRIIGIEATWLFSARVGVSGWLLVPPSLSIAA
jgi:hypothetical protein